MNKSIDVDAKNEQAQVCLMVYERARRQLRDSRLEISVYPMSFTYHHSSSILARSSLYLFFHPPQPMGGEDGDAPPSPPTADGASFRLQSKHVAHRLHHAQVEQRVLFQTIRCASSAID